MGEMITKITGKLVRLGDTEAMLEVPPSMRLRARVRPPAVQSEIGQSVSLRTID